MKLFGLEVQTFNFREKIIKWLENVIIQAELKQLKIEIEINQNIPQLIESDSYKIQNVILNLIGNSIKNTNEGFIKIIIKNEEFEINEE